MFKVRKGNCQPWITVALIDISILVLDISASCQKKILDSDDVKLIIDGKIRKRQINLARQKLVLARLATKGKTQISRFDLNFPQAFIL